MVCLDLDFALNFHHAGVVWPNEHLLIHCKEINWIPILGRRAFESTRGTFWRRGRIVVSETLEIAAFIICEFANIDR